MNAIAHAAAASTAVAVLSSLRTGLQNVQATIPDAGGKSLLRLGRDGVWVYGQENIEVQPGSEWAFNPMSLKHGWIAWTDHRGRPNEVAGEVMVPMTSLLPAYDSLQDVGWPWDQQLSIELVCLTGEDEGTQVLYKTTSVGGSSEMKNLIASLMRQLDTDPEHPVPICTLETDSYTHRTYGKTFTPQFTIRAWGALDQTEYASAGEQQTDYVEQQTDDVEQQTDYVEQQTDYVEQQAAPAAAPAPQRRAPAGQQATSGAAPAPQRRAPAGQQAAPAAAPVAAEQAPAGTAPVRRRPRV